VKYIKKKPYVIKKDDAILKSDPIGYYHLKEDEQNLFKMLDEVVCTSEDATQTDLEGEQL
jgi:hypothetical protein